MTLQTRALSASPTATELQPVAQLLGGPPSERWRRPRNPYQPELHVAEGAVLLTTRRPHTAVTKVVASAWAADLDDADLRSVVTALAERARERGDARLVWEQPETEPAHPARLVDALEGLGAWSLRPPYASAEGTEHIAGWALPLAGSRHSEPPYYAQTTDFTCGAVSALLTVNHLDGGGLEGVDPQRDRRAELAFWRRATNMPAIDPLSLLVELAVELPERRVEASISQPGPLLLEGSEGFMRESKALLQEDARQQAEAAGLTVVTEWLSVDALAQRLQGGALAIVLIDETPMHDDPTPHWVVAHAADAQYVYVQDPWINAAQGETWLDGHDLPISREEFDRMAQWGDPAYRAILTIQ